MKNDTVHEIIIPENEIEITASRSGGAGGQHVNKTSTRITARWNVKTTAVLTEDQKMRVLEKLQSQVTTDGDLIIHSSASRSQQQNKQDALKRLQKTVQKALHVPKKRTATKMPESIKEARLQKKAQRSLTKKMRSKKFEID